MTHVLPNVLLVGAHKSATTGIASDLARQDEVFLPSLKEPHYFVADKVSGRVPRCVTTERDYATLYERAGGVTWRLDASVLYLPYHRIAIPRILGVLGSETRILISVRNPVERAYSAYLDVARGNRCENLSFAAALVAESTRDATDYGSPTMAYRRLGLYAEPVEAFMRAFPRVHVILFEDYVARRGAVLNRVAAFLDIPITNHTVDSGATNKGGQVWASRRLRAVVQNAVVTRGRRGVKRALPRTYGRLRGFVSARFMRTAAPLDPALRDELAAFYRPDIERLEAVIGRDLSAWYHPQQLRDPDRLR